MKLDRLASTTQRLSRESIERARHVAGERIRRVDALEGVEGDRQRSLQQEMGKSTRAPSAPSMAAGRSCRMPVTWRRKWLHWERRPII